LYDAYIDDLFAYGTSISPDKSFVMDGIHDLFLNLYKYHRTLSDANNVKAYLLRSLRSTLLKKNRLKVIHYDDSDRVNGTGNNIELGDSYEDELVAHEQTQHLKEKIECAKKLLTKTQRKVVRMRFEENKSYEEIAEAMQVSITSARTIIYRAIKILRGGVLSLLFILS
jgi:RNA polymerase sigma-70 factor (ECF subfamily)